MSRALFPLEAPISSGAHPGACMTKEVDLDGAQNLKLNIFLGGHDCLHLGGPDWPNLNLK